MVDKFVVDEKRIRNHFVVEIPVTPKWKIEAIAKYNLAQKIKKRKNDIKYVEAPDETSTEITIKRIKLEDIHSPYLEARKELIQLNPIRHSLLWLLKRASQLEIKRNHSP